MDYVGICVRYKAIIEVQRWLTFETKLSFYYRCLKSHRQLSCLPISQKHLSFFYDLFVASLEVYELSDDWVVHLGHALGHMRSFVLDELDSFIENDWFYIFQLLLELILLQSVFPIDKPLYFLRINEGVDGIDWATIWRSSNSGWLLKFWWYKTQQTWINDRSRVSTQYTLLALSHRTAKSRLSLINHGHLWSSTSFLYCTDFWLNRLYFTELHLWLALDFFKVYVIDLIFIFFV